MQITESQSAELARKHGCPQKPVEYRLKQLQIWANETAEYSREQFTARMAELRREGKYHGEATLWFIRSCREQKLPDQEMADLLIALSIGEF